MKKLTAILLLLSLSCPLYSQSLSDLISDLEDVSRIIGDLESSNESLKERLNDLQRNETEREKWLENLEISIEKREELLAELSKQLKQMEQTSQRQIKSYDRLSLRFKVLTYCTVGITVAGVTGWILWAVK